MSLTKVHYWGLWCSFVIVWFLWANLLCAPGFPILAPARVAIFFPFLFIRRARLVMFTFPIV